MPYVDPRTSNREAFVKGISRYRPKVTRLPLVPFGPEGPSIPITANSPIPAPVVSKPPPDNLDIPNIEERYGSAASSSINRDARAELDLALEMLRLRRLDEERAKERARILANSGGNIYDGVSLGNIYNAVSDELGPLRGTIIDPYSYIEQYMNAVDTVRGKK